MLPTTPCHAVVFVSQRTPGDEGYGAEAEEIMALAKTQPGFLHVESVRGADGKGITVAFYDSPAAIDGWRKHPRHREAKDKGRRMWYDNYQIYFVQVERAHEWTRPQDSADGE